MFAGLSMHDLKKSAPSLFQLSKQGFLFMPRCIPHRRRGHPQNLHRNFFRTRPHHFKINDWQSRPVVLSRAFAFLCTLFCSLPSSLEAPQ